MTLMFVRFVLFKSGFVLLCAGEQMDLEKFSCYYCKCKFQELKGIIEHSVDVHSNEQLKIRVLTINEVTGNNTYVRKDFSVLPSEIKAQGKTVVVKDSKVLVDEAIPVDETANIPVDKAANISVDEAVNAPPTCLDEELFTFDGKDAVQRLQDLLPEAVSKLENSGNLATWITLHEMLADGTFPMDNIAFRLFMDVVRFLSLPTSAAMRYSNDVKLFWRAGYLLFKGKFLRFMGGPKHVGQMDDDTIDHKFDPLDARINFVVPKAKYLEPASVLKEEVKPGILKERLHSMAAHTTQAKVSFDGKKINSSLHGTDGDVNLFGCEPPPTHTDLIGRKTQEVEFLKAISERVESGVLSHRDMHDAVQTVSTEKGS